MPLLLEPANESDAAEVFGLRRAVARRLTERFGKGPWSSFGTEAGVERALKTPGLWVVRGREGLVAMLRLSTRKPWAIDPAYFTAAKSPLYLTDMAVVPGLQGTGIGRECLVEARRIASEQHAGAIRLDAYDAEAGAGEFYARCGYREVGRAVFRKTALIYYELLVSPQR